MSLPQVSRRTWLKGAAALTVSSQLQPLFGFAAGDAAADLRLPEARPKAADRRFVSAAVEETIQRLQGRIGDRNLGVLFSNCFPNTLDTTVWPGRFEGKPDTYVVTGDIDAMWLRDSSAQLWDNHRTFGFPCRWKKKSRRAGTVWTRICFNR